MARSSGGKSSGRWRTFTPMPATMESTVPVSASTVSSVRMPQSFFRAEDKVIRPFDARLHTARLERAADGHSNVRRHGHGRRGRAVWPQEHRQVDTLPRVRAERATGPAAPGRLPVGDGAQAVRRAAHGLGLQVTVRGVDLRKALHRRPPRLRQVGQHIPGRKRIRPRAQAVAPVRDRVDVIPVGAQCAHRLADRRARHAQLFRASPHRRDTPLPP